VSHLQRALEHVDVVVAHLEAAKDEPEAPVQVLDFLQVSLHDVEQILEHHRRVLERRRREAERRHT
jgi:hypothetical protein